MKVGLTEVLKEVYCCQSPIVYEPRIGYINTFSVLFMIPTEFLKKFVDEEIIKILGNKV